MQSQSYIEKLSKNQEEMIKELELLRAKITEVDITVNFRTTALESIENTN